MSEDITALIKILAWIAIFFILYLTPSFIAGYRNVEKKAFNMILALNLLLGWTAIVWFILLIVSFIAKSDS